MNKNLSQEKFQKSHQVRWVSVISAGTAWVVGKETHFTTITPFLHFSYKPIPD